MSAYTSPSPTSVNAMNPLCNLDSRSQEVVNYDHIFWTDGRNTPAVNDDNFFDELLQTSLSQSVDDGIWEI